MTRLYSYSIYFMIGAMPCFYTFVGFMVFSTGIEPDPFFILFLLPLPYWIYVIFHTGKVYYDGTKLYISGLFSKELKVITKDMLGSIDKTNIWLKSGRGDYKINYYNENNDIKHLYFTLNTDLENGDGIIDKLNEIN